MESSMQDAVEHCKETHAEQSGKNRPTGFSHRGHNSLAEEVQNGAYAQQGDGNDGGNAQPTLAAFTRLTFLVYTLEGLICKIRRQVHRQFLCLADCLSEGIVFMFCFHV